MRERRVRHVEIARRSTNIMAAGVIALILLTAACGSEEPGDQGVAAPAGEREDEAADGDHSEPGFGQPAGAADADRVVSITADDDFTFDPAQVEVEVGETITFDVANIGKLPHDFTIGDAETQDVHDAEMAEMAEMAMESMTDVDDDANAITMEPGETKSMTWTFTEPGEILMGCHIPGHYAAGMQGTITIADPG